MRQSIATFAQGTTVKISFLVLIYIDLLLTLYALDHGFKEINPFMGYLLDDTARLFMGKVVAPMFIAWLVPIALLLPSIGAMALVVGWNVGSLLTLA